MRILVTGAAGFIGSRTAELLLDRGNVVYGLDLPELASENDALRESRMENVRGRENFDERSVDIRDPWGMEQLFKIMKGNGGLDAVVHLAGLAGVRESRESPAEYYSSNALATLSLLELCRDYCVGKFVFGSTSSVYGDGGEGPTSEDDVSDRPISPYGASKKAVEMVLPLFYEEHGMDVVALRFFTVYGPKGRPDMAIYSFARSVVEGEPLTVFGDGNQERDFTYIDDVALAITAALSFKGHEIMNVGFGSPISVNRVVELIGMAAGKDPLVNYAVPDPSDPLRTWADNSRARALLGWEPRVSPAEGIRRTVEWHKANSEWAKNYV